MMLCGRFETPAMIWSLLERQLNSFLIFILYLSFKHKKQVC